MQTFTSAEYIKIDVASQFGLDKETWAERLAWFDNREPHLENLINEAENPALYYAAVKAWRETQAGQPTGHMISLDATSSGLQILCVLTGDRLGAELCNVVNTGRREDAYTRIYRYMLDQIGDTSKISRGMTKNAIMTALYGSTAVPKQVFGEGELLQVFYHTMEVAAPGAWDLNEGFKAMWNPETLSHDWVLPDNFHVKTPVMDTITETIHILNQPIEIQRKINAPVEGGRALGANVVHSIDGMIVREMGRRCDYDPIRIMMLRDRVDADVSNHRFETETNDDQMVIKLWNHYLNSGYLSARILDHLSWSNLGHVDADEIRRLIDSLPAKPFKVVTVHDCFRCHPNYGNDLRRQYNLQLHLIAKSKLLDNIVSQLLGKPISLGKLDDTLAQDILDADYALS